MIRVLLADDHPVVLNGLAAIVQRAAEMEVVGMARSIAEARVIAGSAGAHVALVDLHFPDGDGATLIAELRALEPPPRVVAISSFLGDEEVHRALKAGARGFVPKDADAEEIVEAIRAVHKGLRHVSPAAAAALAKRLEYEELSARELEVLAGICQGASNKEIGERLGVTESTVKQHVGHILEKLNAPDRTAAALEAIDRGLIRR